MLPCIAQHMENENKEYKNRPSINLMVKKVDQRVIGAFEPYFNAGFGVYF